MKQTIAEIVSNLIGNVKTYVTSKIDLYLLSTFERIAKVHSTIVSSIILILISFFCFFFLTISLAIWLGFYLNDFAISFLIMAGGYFVLGLLFIIFRKSLIDNRILRSLIKSLFPTDKK